MALALIGSILAATGHSSKSKYNAVFHADRVPNPGVPWIWGRIWGPLQIGADNNYKITAIYAGYSSPSPAVARTIPLGKLVPLPRDRRRRIDGTADLELKSAIASRGCTFS